MSEAGEKERRRNLRKEMGDVAVSALENVQKTHAELTKRIQNCGAVLHSHIEATKQGGAKRDTELAELRALVVAASKKVLELEGFVGRVNADLNATTKGQRFNAYIVDECLLAINGMTFFERFAWLFAGRLPRAIAMRDIERVPGFSADEEASDGRNEVSKPAHV